MAKARSLFIALAVILVATPAYLVLRHKRDLVDFQVYRTAAMRAVAAEPLYRPEDGHYQYKYFPAFAFAMAPFAWLPAEVGRASWFALLVGALSIFLRLSVRALPDRRRAARPLLWLTVLLTGKFWVKELVFGQTNVILGLILLSAVLEARKQRPWSAGALVGLAIFVKPYALLFVPWLIWTEGAAAAVACVVVVTAGLVLPAALYGWQGNVDELRGWYRTVTSTTAPNLLDPENISLATMWAKWIGPGHAASILAAASSVAALAFPLVALVKRRRVSEPRYLELGMLMLLVPLLSPQGWDYVLLAAAPAIVCLVDRLAEMEPPWRAMTLAAMVLISFTIFDLNGRYLYTRLMALSIVTPATLVLTASLVRLRWRSLA